MLFSPQLCWADKGMRAYKFRHLTVVDGLSSKWVKSIYRDRLGYLWIGTADGLNRFDGINIRVYKFSVTDSNTINHNFVSAIFEDSRGNLWVGTHVGLNRYIRTKDCFQRVVGINNYVSSFLESATGMLYIGSPGGCLYWILTPGTYGRSTPRLGLSLLSLPVNVEYGLARGMAYFSLTTIFRFRKLIFTCPM